MCDHNLMAGFVMLICIACLLLGYFLGRYENKIEQEEKEAKRKQEEEEKLRREKLFNANLKNANTFFEPEEKGGVKNE